jgi:hypothetical protein
MKPTVAAILSTSLIACYGAAPPKPPVVPLPPISAGAQINVQSESNTAMETIPHESSTCPQGVSPGDPSCVVTHYTTNEPVTRTHSSATYNDQPITYAQFNVLTDPHWDQKLTQLDDLSTRCQHANYPRYAGIAIIAAGLVGGLIAGAAGAGAGAEEGLMYGGGALGLASYALGYFAFGGRQCVEARALFNEMDQSRAMSLNTVEGTDRATEMKTLAEQFNAAHRNGSARLEMRNGQQ